MQIAEMISCATLLIIAIVAGIGVTGFYYKKYGAEYDRYLYNLNLIAVILSGVLMVLLVFNR